MIARPDVVLRDPDLRRIVAELRSDAEHQRRLDQLEALDGLARYREIERTLAELASLTLYSVDELRDALFRGCCGCDKIPPLPPTASVDQLLAMMASETLDGLGTRGIQ